MIQKDLNLFDALKKSSSKSGSSAGGIIAVILSFAVLVGLVFGALLLWETALNAKTGQLRAEMMGEDVQKEQEVFLLLSAKNARLNTYLAGVKGANSRFAQIPKIENTLLDAVASSLPADTRLTALSISPPGLQMTCVSGSKLSAAAFQKTLLKNDIFASATYAGVSAASGGSEYTFSMNCQLNYAALLAKQK